MNPLDKNDSKSVTNIRSIYIFSIISAVLFAVMCAALASQSKRYGPVKCNICTGLHMPYPNGIVREVIDNFVAQNSPGLLNPFAEAISAGDVVTVCNTSACVDYRLNDSGAWEGIAERPIRNAGGGGGGGGGGGSRGSGGGGPVGGGCHGNCGGGSGTVTVGKPTPPGGNRREN